MNHLIESARLAGPPPASHYRVVVEQDARISTRDFEDLNEARRYADDAAAEHSEAPTLAVVVDADFVLIHTGKPYFLK